jgi:hypothetical protein
MTAERVGARGTFDSGASSDLPCARCVLGAGRAVTGLRPGFAALGFMQGIPACESQAEHNAAITLLYCAARHEYRRWRRVPDIRLALASRPGYPSNNGRNRASLFSLRSPINGNFRQSGAVCVRVKTPMIEVMS